MREREYTPAANMPQACAEAEVKTTPEFVGSPIVLTNTTIDANGIKVN